MKLILCITLATAVIGFSPGAPRTSTSRISTTTSRMSIVDDWKEFFSPQERQHRKGLHEKEMAEIEAAQKEILERRRDPSKMVEYHAKEVARHKQLDRQHDVQAEQELTQDWSPSTKKPYTCVTPKTHSVLDDWKQFFSKSEMDHREVQHHLEQLDTADAEQEILKRRRDPGEMKAYKAKQDARHQRLDKQHEIEAGLEFAEEQVDPNLMDGTDFISDVSIPSAADTYGGLYLAYDLSLFLVMQVMNNIFSRNKKKQTK